MDQVYKFLDLQYYVTIFYMYTLLACAVTYQLFMWATAIGSKTVSLLPTILHKKLNRTKKYIDSKRNNEDEAIIFSMLKKLIPGATVCKCASELL